MFKDWALSQFNVKVVKEGKYKGKVCFHTPLFDYTMTRELWNDVKEKLNEV
jgi:hypothetical protein